MSLSGVQLGVGPPPTSARMFVVEKDSTMPIPFPKSLKRVNNYEVCDESEFMRRKKNGFTIGK